MEMMPFDANAVTDRELLLTPEAPASWQWRSLLPVLLNQNTRLRELRTADALPLLSMLTTEEVTRFISPPPVTPEGFAKFIKWTHHKRAAGELVCFGVVPKGYDVAVGIFQIQMPPGESAEWGFALGSPFWGTGAFSQGAEAVLDFAFHGMGLEELCARAAVENGRGNGALRKVGAVCEHIIPGGLVRNGRPLDQYHWTLTADGRPRRKVIWEQPAH
jgi:RimJ/RimL family protein N-acetyltransferase